MSDDLPPGAARHITRLHPATATRRQRLIHVFSARGYELTVPASFRDKRLHLGGAIDDEDVEQMKTAARLWEAGVSERRAARAEAAALKRPTAGVVTEISEGRRERLHIYLDGGYAFSLSPETAEYEAVVVGRSLSEKEVHDLVSRAHVERLGGMIDRLTAIRPRCAGEIRDRLVRERKLDPDLVERAIERRARLGTILSDADFIDYFARTRAVSRGKGFWDLAPKLRALHVDPVAIEAYRERFDTAGAAQVAIGKAARGLDLSDRAARAKFAARLRSRGFGYEVASKYLTDRDIGHEELAEAADEQR
jgi:SOS response regulatory protein OraA/RecX